jgi:gliding motility-associated-like protein
MSLKSQFFFCLLILGLLTSFLYGQSSTKGNIGFQNGSFKGWTGYNWRIYINNANSPETSTPPQTNTIYSFHGDTIGNATINSTDYHRRQLIISDTTAYDINTDYKLKKIPIGYKYSARLGDAMTTSDSYPRGWEQSLQYNLKVDSTNSLLILKFACVLEYAPDHSSNVEPRFKLTLYDSGGKAFTTCTDYDVYASSGSVSGFQTYDYSKNNKNDGYSSGIISWRDWTTVGADLSAYKGQTITIEFMSADCRQIHHFGYAYFVAETHPMIIAVQYCSGDTDAKLIAPEGFLTYVWTDSNGNTVGNSQTLVVPNPNEGAMYYCDLTSATGCQVRLSSKVIRYEPNADFKFDLLDCNKLTNTMKFSNLHPAKNGYLTYNWDFGDGKLQSADTVSHTFNSSGLHKVKLIVSNPPSTCADTVTKTVETFYPPLVRIAGDSLYCKGEKTVLKGVGAYRYKWSDGSTGDSILVGKDTKVWMIGYSSVGCYTDTIWKKIKAAPDWTFDVQGRPLFCQGESTTLTATDAVSYLWSTGDKTKSLKINKPGPYSVIGTNEYGCKITVSLQVVEDSLPNPNFTLSSATVDEKHNSLICTTAGQTGVGYVWDMGDGNMENGAIINHKYAVDNLLSDYKISLTATNSNGCINTSTKSVNVILFVPNIFSPNGDGINDRFVVGPQVQIFDRNGLKLFEGKTGWDGTYNGIKVDNDTYFYRIIYKEITGTEKLLKGYITLKR